MCGEGIYESVYKAHFQLGGVYMLTRQVKKTIVMWCYECCRERAFVQQPNGLHECNRCHQQKAVN